MTRNKSAAQIIKDHSTVKMKPVFLFSYFFKYQIQHRGTATTIATVRRFVSTFAVVWRAISSEKNAISSEKKAISGQKKACANIVSTREENKTT